MANIIKPKRGNSDPPQGTLAEGEIGINLKDSTAFVGTAGGGSQKLKADNVTGVVSIEHGGTGSISRAAAFKALQNGEIFSGDFNTLTESGVYWCNLTGSSNGPNPPAGVGYGFLEVINNVNIQQRFECFEYSSYTRTFANDVWSVWQCNYSSKDVIGINNGGTGANTASDARINLGAAAGVVEHYAPYYGANNQPYTDLRLINVNNSLGDANADWSFGTEDASTLVNSPVTSGPFYGYRKVYQVHSSVANHYKTIVEIHEAYPCRGRIWTSEYNPDNGWFGWWHNYTNADQIPISNGGTGAKNAFNAQKNLSIIHTHDISASNQDDWRTKALAQIAKNAKVGGFQCGSIGWAGMQYGQYFATTSGATTDRILALIYNSNATNYALEVWRYEAGTWNQCAIKGASLQTLPKSGYGTANQRPAAGLPGRIYFQKV